MKIVDSFLDKKDFTVVYDYCYSSKYSYGEQDNPDTPVTGMITEIDQTHIVWSIVESAIVKKHLKPDNLNISRMYINCFAPGEIPYYHRDESMWTFLLYINKFIDINNGGETILLDEDNNMIGILPLQNRLLKFKGNLLHKATSNRYDHRFTLAIKY